MVKSKSKNNRNIAVTVKETNEKKSQVRVRKDLQQVEVEEECEVVKVEEECEVVKVEEECEVVELEEEAVRHKRRGEVSVVEVEAKVRRVEARPFVARQARGREGEVLSSVQVLGVDLLYRPHLHTILLKTGPVLELLGRALPLAPASLSSVVGSGQVTRTVSTSTT